MIRSLVFLLIVFTSNLTLAGRRLVGPAFPIRATIPSFTGTGKPGVILSYELTLDNLSSNDQLVTVTFDKLSYAWGRQWSGSTLVYAKTAVSVCSGSENDSTSFNDIQGSIASDALASLTFTLVRESRKVVTLVVIHRDDSGVMKASGMDTLANPVITIEVEEDKGAIRATAYPVLNGIGNGTSMCGIDLSGMEGGFDVNAVSSFTSFPMQFNGGRPF